MKVVIIEDEIPSRLNLRRALASIADDLDFVALLGSVAEAVDWFKANPDKADLVFMDVQLSDGLCFDIFKSVNVGGNIIITTAYDHYALDAFKIHSIDYLLKPIEVDALCSAVEHCRSLAKPKQNLNYATLADILAVQQKNHYKDRFLVKIGDKIIPIDVDSITLFFAESKTTYLATDEGREYIIDESLDSVESKIDGTKFFRIGRSHIVALKYINVVTKHFSSRLKVQLKHTRRDDLFVSRSRANEFLNWLNGNK